MKKIAIFGTGGHAKELLDLVWDQGYRNVCFLEKDVQNQHTLLDFPILSESALAEFEDTDFAIGVADPVIREKIYNLYPHLHYPNLVHSQASLGYGVLDQLMHCKGIVVAAGARITNSCEFGNFIIVSFNSTIGHDCTLDDFVSVMPSANISGCIHLQSGVYIGTNATILPGKSPQALKTLAHSSIIGAGAVVLKDTIPKAVYIGMPAREKK